MKVRLGNYQTWWSTYLAIFAIVLAASNAHGGLAFFASVIAMFGGFALRNRPYSNVLRTMVLLTFITIFVGYLVDALGGDLSQSVYFSTLSAAITSFIVSMPQHNQDAVSTRIRIPGFAFAAVPLMISLPIAATYSARWTQWLSWGGDFGLHRHLIESLADGNHFTIGVVGTPITWHYLVYLFLGKSIPSISQFAIAVITTFTVLAVVAIIVATPRGSGRTRFLIAAGVSLILTSTVVIQFIVAGFVTTTASTAFAIATLYFAMPRKDAEFTPISLAYASMAASVAICLWQPMIFIVFVIILSMLPRVISHFREFSNSPLIVVSVFCSGLLILRMLYLTKQSGASGGGAAPAFSTEFALALAVLVIILSLQLDFTPLVIYNVLVAGIGSLTLFFVWWRTGWGALEYFPRKVAWVFLVICLIQLIRVIAKSFEQESRLGWRALASFIAAFLLVGGHIDWAISRTWLRDTVQPNTKVAAIFTAIDEVEKSNAQGAFFIKSGDDYIANLWVKFGLNLPSGPVDSSLKSQIGRKDLCDFVALYSTAPIYTRKPVLIHAFLQDCDSPSTNPVIDLRTYAVSS